MFVYRFVSFAFISAVLSACTPTVTPPAFLSEYEYNQEEIAWAFAEGSATIQGNAFLRQRGGGIVTCAGSTVRLIAKGLYSEERMQMIYGMRPEGYEDVNDRRNVEQAQPAYVRDMRTTVCNSDGNFKFENLPSGTYYITTTIVWNISSYSKSGGAVMKRLELREGETKSVVMTGGATN